MVTLPRFVVPELDVEDVSRPELLVVVFPDEMVVVTAVDEPVVPVFTF